MQSWPLIVVAFVGCDQVFSLETVADPPLEVHGTFRSRTVVNDSKFEPLRVERLMASANLTFRVMLDDGSEPTVLYNEESGSFRFEVPELGIPYRLQWLADGLLTELQLDAPELIVGTTLAGRPDASPLQRSTVSFNYPMPPVRTAHIVSTGVYTQTDTATTGPMVDFDWRLANSVGGLGARMLDADAFDRLYVFEPETVTAEGNSPPWTRYRAMSSASITQALGTAAMMPALQPVTPNSCAHLVVNGNAEHLRIKSAHPRNYVTESQSWWTYAAPALDYVGLSGQLSTASCSVSTPVTDFDFDVTPSFHDPFKGTTLVAASSAIAQFYVQRQPADAVLVANSTTVHIAVERGNPTSCTPAVGTITPTVAIPGKFVLDGTDLKFDGQQVALDILRAPTLEWENLVGGPADYYSVSLQEVDAINNKTVLVPRWAVSTPHRYARIEPRFLVAGRTYIFAVTATTGRPEFVNGDFLTVTMPIQTATFFSFAFTVQAL